MKLIKLLQKYSECIVGTLDFFKKYLRYSPFGGMEYLGIFILFMLFMVGFTIAPLPYDLSNIFSGWVFSSKESLFTNLAYSVAAIFFGVCSFILAIGYLVGGLFIPYNQVIGSLIIKLFEIMIVIIVGYILLAIVVSGIWVEDKKKKNSHK